MSPKTLMDLASISSSSLIFVTHPSFWIPQLSQQFLDTQDQFSRWGCQVPLPRTPASSSPLPADACSSLKAHLNRHFPSPGLDLAPRFFHSPLLQLQTHTIILEPPGIQIQVWEFFVGRRA